MMVAYISREGLSITFVVDDPWHCRIMSLTARCRRRITQAEKNKPAASDPPRAGLRNRGMNVCSEAQSAAPVALAWMSLAVPPVRVGRRAVALRRALPMTVADESIPDEMTRLLGAVARDRDRVAFQALFEHFAPRVKAFILRQGTDPGMAEEVVQETMVNVWRKAAQFDPAKASASTWIFKIARNLRIDLLRKAYRPEPDMNDPAMVGDPEPMADDVVSRRQHAGHLRVALATLPAEQQQVLQLAFFREKAHAQVADELGLPLGTVKSRIRLALARLRSELGEFE